MRIGLVLGLLTILLLPPVVADLPNINGQAPPKPVIPASEATSFDGGYSSDESGNVTYAQQGTWSGLPACHGPWLGPFSASISSSARRMTVGTNTVTGFVVLEIGDGSRVNHTEWKCSSGAYVDTLSCSSVPDWTPMSGYRATPRAAVSTTVPLPTGWSNLTAGGAQNRASFAEQTVPLTVDLSVNQLRGSEALPAGDLPFSGRVRWRVWADELDGVRSDNYLFGQNLCNSASQEDTASGVIQYDAMPGQSVSTSALWTNGAPVRDVVPLPPLPPVGDWALVMQACNGGC